MSSPPEEPYFYPEHHNELPAPKPRRVSRATAAGSPGAFALGIISLLLGMACFALFLLFSTFNRSPFQPSIPDADTRATAEAHTFSTTQVYRQHTRQAANSTSTALAVASITAEAQVEGTALVYPYATATVAARATAEAPSTLTAQALSFLEEEAHAWATIEALDPAAVLVYGPAAGALAHNPDNIAVCDDTGVQLRSFIAEARFYNPYPIDHDWDYSIVFTNPADGTQYSAVVDADQHRSFRLQAPGYYVQLIDTTSLIDNSDNGSNTLRLYVTGDVVHLYINGHFATTLDLASLDFGNVADGPHDLLVCTGLMDGDMQPGKSTRYEGLTLWKLP